MNVRQITAAAVLVCGFSIVGTGVASAEDATTTTTSTETTTTTTTETTTTETPVAPAASELTARFDKKVKVDGKRIKNAWRGAVTSASADCLANRDVTIFKVTKKGPRVWVTAKTATDGTFVVRKRKSHASYYASVAATTACAAAETAPFKVA